MSMSGVGGAVIDTARVVYALSFREAQSRNAESPLGLFSLIFEPLATICMMTIIFTYVRLRTPGMGDFIMLFLLTGIVPLSVFRNSVSGGNRAYQRMKKLLVLPSIQPIDLVWSGIFMNFVACMILYSMLSIFFEVFYSTNEPEHFFLSMVPAIGNACIGFGICMLNMIIMLHFKFWGTIFGIMTMPLNIMSGMFFTAETLPPQLLKYLYYNPFLHSTELTRTFFFPEYHSTFFDPYYYGVWVLGGFAVGLLLERAYRYRLLQATV